MTNQGPIPQPDLQSILGQDRDSAYSALACVRIGTIVAYDATKQKATIQLVNPSEVWNQAPVGGAIPAAPAVYPIPPLQDVPVLQICGGSAYLGMPIKAGDTCIVWFNDRDLDPWASNGTTGAVPNSTRMHSLADGIALVGVRPFTNPLSNLPSDGKHITFGNGQQTMISLLNGLIAALNALVSTDGAIIGALNSLNSVKDGGDASAAITAASNASSSSAGTISTANTNNQELFQ
jgi:hypothetical protein